MAKSGVGVKEQVSKPTATHARSANAAIKGYVYQFDKTILELLHSGPDDVITVEGIEDIDIVTATAQQAIQCKYLAASKFSLPAIRDPVLLMLDHFSRNGGHNYTIYIYCQDQSGLTESLSVDDLKACLTKKSRDSKVPKYLYKGYGSDVLTNFVKRLTIVGGDEFGAQQAAAHSELAKQLSGTLEDSTDLYYPKALSIVLELAIKGALSSRRISKTEFLGQLNIRNKMYTRWHSQMVGIDAFVKSMQRRLRSSKDLSSTKTRALILDPAEEAMAGDYCKLICALSIRGYGIGKLTTARPWTVVLDGTAQKVSSLKSSVVDQNITVNDGFESLSFNPSLFERPPVINTGSLGKKITATSYDIRVISLKTYKQHVGSIKTPDSFVSLSSKSLAGIGERALYLTNLPIERILEILEVQGD